jgi:hypothetical protein
MLLCRSLLRFVYLMAVLWKAYWKEGIRTDLETCACSL